MSKLRPWVLWVRITLEFKIKTKSHRLLAYSVHYNIQGLKAAILILLNKPSIINIRKIWIKVHSLKSLIKYLDQLRMKWYIQQRELRKMNQLVVIREIWILIFKLCNCWVWRRTSRVPLIWTNQVCWKISEWWTSQTTIMRIIFRMDKLLVK
jgi:hypothetical protein